jgi:hypothetical protein
MSASPTDEYLVSGRATSAPGHQRSRESGMVAATHLGQVRREERRLRVNDLIASPLPRRRPIDGGREGVFATDVVVESLVGELCGSSLGQHAAPTATGTSSPPRCVRGLHQGSGDHGGELGRSGRVARLRPDGRIELAAMAEAVGSTEEGGFDVREGRRKVLRRR